MSELPVLTAIAAAGLVAVVVAVRRRFVAVRVVGQSMEPAYKDGDLVLVRRIGPDDIRAGQVVAIAYPDRGSAPLNVPPWLMKRVRTVPGEPVPAGIPALVPDSVVPRGCLLLLGGQSGGQP